MTRHFSEPPGMGRVYLRALVEGKRRFDPAAGLPEMRSKLDAQTLDADLLKKYREACGARADVPVAFPQLIVTPLHVALLTDDEFPMRAMGLVHPRFSITQHRELHEGDEVSFESWFDGVREVRNGVEFDIETRAFIGDELVWESTAATFHRTGNDRSGVRPEEPTWDDAEARTFDAPANAGRRYARVSGDANPVHLHPLTSRLFGYKKPIAHGWWLVARCVDELDLQRDVPTNYAFDFRRPVFLGKSYRLASREVSEDAVEFAVVDDQGKNRLLGKRRKVAASSQ